MGTGRHRYSCYHLDHRHFFIFSQGVVSWRETQGVIPTLSLWWHLDVAVYGVLCKMVGALVVWCEIGKQSVENPLCTCALPDVLCIFFVWCGIYSEY